MKKLVILALLCSWCFFLGNATALAANKAPLGQGNLAVKVDYINFTDDAAEDLDVDDGLYLGLEGYGAVAENTYLGLEVGWAENEGDFLGVDTELTYIPVEVNFKYAFASGTGLVFDIGLGGSYNYAEIEASLPPFGTISEDDWFWGGQVFADLNYAGDRFFLGVNGKYQGVEEDLDNWRIGGQAGLKF